MDKSDKFRPPSKNNTKKSKLSFLLVFKSLLPSLIAGAADNDPSAIANYSQAGAKFGFGLLWLPLLLYPFMTVIVGICARIGIVTGSGLTTVISKKYSKKIAFLIVTLLIVGNIMNISADLGAMALCFYQTYISTNTLNRIFNIFFNYYFTKCDSYSL